MLENITQCFVIFPSIKFVPIPVTLETPSSLLPLPVHSRPRFHLPVPLLNMRGQNVKAQPEILNILSNTRVFIAVEKRVELEILELAPLFLLRKGTYGTKNW